MINQHKDFPPYFLLKHEENATLSLLCEELGFHTFLERLYWHYNKEIKISRVLCFTLDKISHVIFPVEDINENVSILPNPYKGAPKLFNLADLYDEEEGKVYFFKISNEACKEYFEFIDPKHRSALLLMVHNNEDFVSFVQIFSNDEEAFSEEHARTLMQIRNPVRAVLQDRYYKYNLRSALLPEYTGDSLALLRMCENLKPVLKKVEFLAPSNRHLTIIGETGVGKELFAEAVHMLSKRSNAPLIKINCGAINENLVDSELFGYERGAFTGAVNSHAGYFEQADGGTLFLDEVGELTPATQVRLLRVLDRGEIRRVGGMRTLKVDVRVVAATHRNLSAEVGAKRFREDLWYRLCVFPIIVPPLRERHDDIITLLKYFMNVKCQAMDIKPLPVLDAGEMFRISRSPWRGNVRQLEYTVEHSLLEYKASNKEKFHINMEPIEENNTSKAVLDFSHQILPLHQVNKLYIEHVLAKCKGKISGKEGAATLLDIPVSTLRAKLQKYSINPKKKY